MFEEYAEEKGFELNTQIANNDANKQISQCENLINQGVDVLIVQSLDAEAKGVKIAIENCPMLFTNDEWPGGQNLMTSPANWRKIFEILDSDYIGINYDPSHFVWQQIDYIKPIYEFADKIFHVHFKDIKLYKDALADVGIMATPLQFMAPKIPGLGDVDWGAFVSALTDIGYKGAACQEIEDRAFEDSMESIEKSILLSTRYLRNFV